MRPVTARLQKGDDHSAVRPKEGSAPFQVAAAAVRPGGFPCPSCIASSTVDCVLAQPKRRKHDHIGCELTSVQRLLHSVRSAMHDELAEARPSYAFRCTVPVVRVYVAQHTSITEGDRCVRALRCFNADRRRLRRHISSNGAGDSVARVHRQCGRHVLLDTAPYAALCRPCPLPLQGVDVSVRTTAARCDLSSALQSVSTPLRCPRDWLRTVPIIRQPPPPPSPRPRPCPRSSRPAKESWCTLL